MLIWKQCYTLSTGSQQQWHGFDLAKEQAVSAVMWLDLLSLARLSG